MTSQPGPVPNSQGHASASLYVGDLAADVTEALLFEIFNAVGPVASIRICRDAVTRRSLGYAYVNFHNVIDAERALDTMNFITIRSRPCRIMWSQRDPSLRKSGVGNVFVKNLDRSIDHKTLYDTFSMFGNILSCKVATTDNGESRGYGFVHYTNPESAQKAILKVNGMVIAEKKVTVAQFIPKEQRQQGVKRFTNVYVSGFPKNWNREKFMEFFAQAGTINSVYLTEKDGRPFGFANFPDHDHAAAAVEKFHDKEVDGVRLYVARAMKREERTKFLKQKFEKLKSDYQKKFAGVNLYVKYLDDTIDDERLRKEFEKFGTITSAKVMRDANDRSRGFGFVCFQNQEESTRAMAEMNSKIVEGKPLYVALAQRKEMRKVALEKEGIIQKRANRGFQPGRGRGGMRGRQPMKQGPMGYQPGYNPQMGNYGNRGMNPMMFQQQRNPMQWGRGGPPMQNMIPNNFRPMAHQYGGPMQGMTGVQGVPQPRANRGQPPAQVGQMPMNPAMNTQRPPQQKPAQAQRPSDHTKPLTSDMLSQANPSQQKQMIGERIFPRIQAREPKLAGKITGMLLEMDNMELLHLLDDQAALTGKINEALAVLNQHSTNEEPLAGAE